MVAGWNGMVISALSRAYRVLGDEAYLHAAEQCAATLRATLYDEATGELKRLSLHNAVSQVHMGNDPCNDNHMQP